MKLKPLADNVCIKRLEKLETTKGGLLLPSTAKEKPEVVEVVAVGPGGMVDGKEIVMTVKPGDKVVISKYAGMEVKVGDDEIVIVRLNDIKAIVED
ncbi:MAG: co-chaperone GroES [Christensenellales bacterium]